ncbi:MAG: DUF1549 and DUF1553 domain-containing protein [Bythopirellula sp.]
MADTPPQSVSFRNDVLPVLAKMGCNTGACHGALAGKGGFKLSLRGYDPLSDYQTIAIEARGRRIELGDPGRSLILAKPSGAIPHKGGLRFEVGSPEYELLANWIAQGARPPEADDPQVERIEVLPDRSTLSMNAKLPVTVKAHFSDGEIRDVTRWAIFESTDLSVATVGDGGEISIVGPGKGAISVWFASKIAIARVMVPFDNLVPADIFSSERAVNFIDELVLAELQDLNLPPSLQANDSNWIRRVFIDTIGCLPRADEVRSFLQDAREDKRARLIESLLSRPEFVDYWTYKWSDILLVSSRKLRPEAVKSYSQWIRQQVEKNTAWDQFARKVVTAKGHSFEQGASNFFAIHQDAESMTENVCQAFLGLSIGCAKCHNHPLEKWTNDQYYAMASMFARVRGKGWGGDAREGDGSRTVFVASSGELLQPSTGKPQPPRPLDGEPLPGDFEDDRRELLADWLTSPKNPYFAKAIANRIWANFFNVGLVEDVDDLRVSNPASNERLLDALAEYLVDQDYDVQQLMRAILASNTYSRSSVALPDNQADRQFYSRYYPQRLMAEVLHDAIVQVTGVPTEFKELSLQGADVVTTEFYPEGTRALELYDSAVRSQFLKSFGRNPRAITCECERSDEPNMVQVLHIANGDTINEKLRTKGNRVDELLSSGLSDYRMPDYRIIEEIFLSSVSRYPTDKEMRELLPLLVSSTNDAKRLALEDLVWSVLSSREFMFNH